MEKPPVSPTLRLLSQEHRGGTQITDPSSSMGRKPSPLAPSPAKRLLHTSQLPAEQASSWPLATAAAPPRTRSHTILTPQGWKGRTWSWGNQGPGCMKVALSVFGPGPSGVWSRWGWQGPQRTGTPCSGLRTSFKGLEAPWNQAQGQESRGRRPHQAEGTVCTKVQGGHTQGTAHQERPWGPPRERPRPGGELPGQAHPTLMGPEGWHRAGGHCRQEGRGQGGRRDAISADQAPAPTALGEKRSFPQLRKILFAGRKKGNPESLYSRPRCSHSLTVGAGPPRPRGPSPTEDTRTPIPTRDPGGGPRGLDRERNPPVHAKATPGDRSHS